MKFDFSKNYEKLQKIVQDLESDDFSLESNLDRFEEGLKIAESLKKYLAETENRVKEIKNKFLIDNG